MRAEGGADWRGLVVYGAGTAWNGNRGTDQHMAAAVARHLPVLYVDPPVSRLSPLRNPDARAALERPRLRVLGPRLARLTPVVPPAATRPGMRAVAAARTRQVIARAVGRLGARGDVRALVAASTVPVFGAAGERRRVFYGTDDFAAGAALMGVSATSAARRQAAAIAAADRVVVVSEHLAARWRTGDVCPVVIENGVDLEAFAAVDSAPVPPDVRLAGPIAGLVGHLSARIDLDLLEAVVDRGASLLLVGPLDPTFEPARVAALLDRSNVRWVGPKPFAELPSYLRMIDVGLVPYRDDEFNRASFPLKALEYLAAGRAVVATDLPAMAGLGGVVRVASGAGGFAAAVARELRVGAGPAERAARRAVASTRTWDAAAARLVDELGGGGQA